MKIGNIELGNLPLFLAPMEDVTYKSFRYMCKKYGADVMCTEFVSSEALIREVKKTRQKMTLFDFDRPVAIQIFGHNIDSMVEAAKIVEQSNPDFIDINFGCPMKKIVSKGAGAGMLQDVPKMVEMTRRIVDSVKLPVTAKTRLGWDDNNKIIVDVAERLQDTGISALTIHGRTRKQLYTGEADWTLIGEVKNNPRMIIPIIGNGDISSPQRAKQFYEQTGVDALMIGRGAIGRPWIFKEIKHYFQTGEELPSPTVPEVVENVKAQLAISLEWKDDERRAVNEMRRHFAKYFPSLPNFREIRIELLRSETYSDCYRILDEIADRYALYRVSYENISLK
jgi:tRNA-dihydrouridine synthase B